MLSPEPQYFLSAISLTLSLLSVEILEKSQWVMTVRVERRLLKLSGRSFFCHHDQNSKVTVKPSGAQPSFSSVVLPLLLESLGQDRAQGTES